MGGFETRPYVATSRPFRGAKEAVGVLSHAIGDRAVGGIGGF